MKRKTEVDEFNRVYRRKKKKKNWLLNGMRQKRKRKKWCVYVFMFWTCWNRGTRFLQNDCYDVNEKEMIRMISKMRKIMDIAM